MADRFCMYCQQFRKDEGFIFVVHRKTLTKRGQCPSCQARRKLPRAELEKLAKQEADARRARAAEIAAEAAERKRKNEDPTGE